MATIIERQCLGDQIRKALIEKIVSGQLKSGERLVELALAKEFETSQTPVREALRDLEAMRMVEALPHRGVRVRDVTDQEMAEAYAIRALLEEHAAHLAVRRLAGDVTELQQHASEIQAAAERRDLPAYAESNLAFHRAVVEYAENTTLLRLWDSLAFEFRTLLRMRRYPTDLVKNAADHFPIVEALAAGDGLTAGRLLRQHAESFIAVIKAGEGV